MIGRNSRIVSKNGNVSIVNQSVNTSGIMSKQGPDPVWNMPSTSSYIPHTSVMSNMEVDRTSLAFVGRTYHANLVPVMNYNANGRFNA